MTSLGLDSLDLGRRDSQTKPNKNYDLILKMSSKSTIDFPDPLSANQTASEDLHNNDKSQNNSRLAEN